MRSVNALPVTKRVVQSKYGCFWLRGERTYARRKEEAETLANVLS